VKRRRDAGSTRSRVKWRRVDEDATMRASVIEQRVIDFIHLQHLFRGNSGDSHPDLSSIQFFLCVSYTPTYSNFQPGRDIGFFPRGEGGARGINRRYYSCNWQSRGNFWLVWNSFLRLYYDHLSFLTFRPCFRVDDPRDRTASSLDIIVANITGP